MGFNPSIVSQIGRFLVRLQTSGQSATTDTPGFKPFTILRSLGRQSERLANNYISLVSTVSRIRQQLWFNHRCKDQGLVPLLPTNLLDTVTTIANRRADKTTDRVRTEQERKLTTLQHNTLYTSLSANTIMAILTNHVQRTRLIRSSTDKHYSLDSEDDFPSGCRNVSHQQQFFSELHSPGRSHYTNY